MTVLPADLGNGLVASSKDAGGWPSDVFEVAIVGAGPAGSALAAILSKGGRSVALLDRDRFPRDKLCGEFLSGESRRLLREIGCLEEVERRRPARIQRARLTTASGKVLEASLPSEAFGISRWALDEILFRHAASCGAVALDDAEVRGISGDSGGASDFFSPCGARLEVRLGESRGGAGAASLRAGIVIGAYGRRERLDKDFGRLFLKDDSPYAGLKRHLRPLPGAAGAALAADLAGCVEIHAFDGGYCGINLVEDRKVNACVLLEKRFLKRLGSTRWEVLCGAMAKANPGLKQRLAALAPADDCVHAVGRVPFGAKERSIWPLIFVGDAAGMIAPFCGDGQAIALESAAILASLVNALPRAPKRDDFERLGRRWDRRWRSEFGRRVWLGRGLQRILFSPVSAEIAVAILRLLPPLARYLVRVTRGK